MRQLLRLLFALILSMASLGMTLAVLLSAVTSLPTASAEKIVIHKIQEAQRQFHLEEEAKEASPFLSATMKTEVSPVAAAINSDQLNLLSNALAGFLQKVFDDQQVYDVKVIGVAVFEETLVENDGGRRLALNSLQAQTNQFHPAQYEDDEYDEYDDDEYDDGYWDDDGWENGSYTLTFATVVSAEHKMHQTLSHANFQTMLTHIFHKFESHLVDFVAGIEDDYFANVESVVVSGYEVPDAQQTYGYGEKEAPSIANESEPSVSDPSGSRPRLVVGLVVSTIVFVVMGIAATRLYRRSKQLETNKWKLRQIASNNAASTSIKSLRVLYQKPQDDYSFDPSETDNGYTGRTSFEDVVADNTFYSPGSETIPRHPGFTMRDTVDDNYRSDLLFQLDEIPNPISASKLPLEEAQQTQDVFAPPGKVGVAIDVVDGQPIVHKVKKGSPLEGLLQPNDVLVAIDDVDTTSMSAADVTQLMVKSMNYRRKITFVRKEA